MRMLVCRYKSNLEACDLSIKYVQYPGKQMTSRSLLQLVFPQKDTLVLGNQKSPSEVSIFWAYAIDSSPY